MLCSRVLVCFYCSPFFFFKQKTAYEMRISDWSSDVCSSDLHHALEIAGEAGRDVERLAIAPRAMDVEQAREYFVDGIEWRPRAVEVETARANIAVRTSVV